MAVILPGGGGGTGGAVKSTTPPKNTKLLWVDLSAGGVLKYHNGTSWVPIKPTWGA